MESASPPIRRIRDPCRFGLVEEDPPDRRTFGERLRCGEAMLNQDLWDERPVGHYFPDLDDGDEDTEPPV